METREVRTLHITMGLPGCGKTTWAKGFIGNLPKRALPGRYTHYPSGSHIEHDEVRHRSSIEDLAKQITTYNRNFYHVVLDTLVTSDKGIRKIIDLLKPFNYEKIIIHRWEPNREACLINDKFRRDSNAENTIKHAIVDVPDIEKLMEYLHDKINPKPVMVNGSLTKPVSRNIPIEVENHKTERKEDWKIFLDYLRSIYPSLYYDEKKQSVVSESWSTGGNWGDCWGNSGSISGENPREFSSFDKIMEILSPDISFLKYKRIKDECVQFGEKGSSDYYGGYSSDGYWYFEVKKFYEILVREGLYKISI